MDYSREQNGYISSNSGMDAAVCQETLREWRKLGSNACVLDLKKVYLQLHVVEKLQRFQAVKYKGQCCML